MKNHFLTAKILNTLIGNFIYIVYKSMQILIIIIIERPLPVLTEKKKSTSHGENSGGYTACFPEKSVKWDQTFAVKNI